MRGTGVSSRSGFILTLHILVDDINDESESISTGKMWSARIGYSSLAIVRSPAASVWRSRGRIIARQSYSVGRSFSTTRMHFEQPTSTAIPPARDGLNGSSMQIASQDLLETYRGLVASGRLAWDDEQVRTVMKVRYTLPVSNKTLS